MKPYVLLCYCAYCAQYNRNILLCGNMDRSAYVVETDLETDKAKVLHQFSDHTKLVRSRGVKRAGVDLLMVFTLQVCGASTMVTFREVSSDRFL